MTKTILITGSTDGIGFEAARRLALGGHDLILHGRNPAKLDRAVAELKKLGGAGKVDPEAVGGAVRLSAGEAYAQSKLALTMWSRHLADALDDAGPAIIAVNPGSLLATKMVKEGYGIAGNDIGIGAHRFAPPHPDALDAQKNEAVARLIETIIARLT